MTDFQINALVTEVGVSMGDHGQDVTKAIEVDPNMTVGQLCQKALTKIPWERLMNPEPENDVKAEADGNKYLTIRLAVKP